MSDTIDFLKGLNKSAFNLINPFSNGKMSEEELENREQEFSDLSYAWNSYYTQRLNMEDTLDRINFLNKAKKAELDRKEFLMNFLGKEIDDKEMQDMIATYDKELEQLELHKKIQLASMNYAQKNLGGIQKYITAPLYDVLVDVSSVTDMGDVISLGRVGLAAASAGIGAGVAAGSTQLGLGTVGTAVAGEAVTSIADTALDVARVKDETGEELGITDVAKMYGTNVVSGLAMQGISAGVGYAFGKIFNKVKTKINTVGAEAVNSPNAPKNNPDLSSNGTISEAPEAALKSVLGEESGEQMADMIKNAAVEKFDSFDDSIDPRKSTTLNMDTTTPEERKIMNSFIQDFKKNSDNKYMTESELMKLPETQRFINQAMKGKTNKTMIDFSQMVAINARNIANLAQEQAKIDNVDASSFITKDSLFVKEWVNSISILKEQTSQKLSKQINFAISSKGSQIGINNYVDFIKYSKENNIDIMRSFFTGELGEDMPLEYKQVFSYLKELTYKYSIEVTPRQIFREEDNIIKNAKELLVGDMFVVSDYIPQGWDFEKGMPLMIDPRMSREDFLEKVVSLRNMFEATLSPYIDSKKIMKNFFKSELLEYNEAIEAVFTKNIAQTRLNFIDNLVRAGLNKRQAKKLYKSLDRVRKESEVDLGPLELIETINKDFSKRDTIKNRLFSFIPKNQAMSDEDLFMITKLDEGVNKTIKEFASSEEVLKNKELTKEQLERMNEILGATQKYLGGNYNPRIEKAYFGIDLPLAQGRSKTVDIRTTPITDLAEIYFKERGVLDKTFEELDPEQKLEILDTIGLDIHTKMTRNVGTVVRLQTGIEDSRMLINDSLTKWGIDKKDIVVRFKDNAKNFEAYVKKMKDGKILINLNYTEDMDLDLQLGVTRHELQHIYDMKVLNSDSDSFYLENFKNIPSVKDTKVFSKVLGGQNVTVREFMGTYYGNHFYSPFNDNFENNYLSAVARDKFDKRSAFEKTQDFFSLLKATTQARAESRSHVKEIFRFLADAKDIPDFLDEEFYQDFAIKSFISPNDMYDYVDVLANTGNNKMKNITANYSKIVSRMTTEEQGFSINTLLNQLNSSKIRADLLKSGVKVDDLMNNTNVERAIYSIREGIRERFIASGSREYDPLSPFNLFSTGVSSALIGTRQFTEALTSPIMAGVSTILNGGDLKKAALLTLQNYPMAYKNYVKSYIYGAGTIVENFGNFVNMNINAATQTLLNMQFKQNFTMQLADTLHRVGNIKNKNISLTDAKLFADFTAQISILNSGGDPESYLAKMARLFNTSLHGNKADDIQLQMIAQKAAESEFYNMVSKQKYIELNEIQKKMYSMSGFSNEEFGEWRKFVKVVLSANDERIPDSAFSLKMMLAQGEGLIDIMGMSRRTTNSEPNPFLYMCQTMYNAALLALQKLKSTSTNGITLEQGIDFKTVMKLTGITALGLVGIGATIPKQTVENLLFGTKTTLDDFEKAYEKFEEDKTKGSYEIVKTVLDAAGQQTPFAYTLSPSSNGFGVLGAAYSLTDRNVYDFSTGEVRSPKQILSIFAAPIISSRLLMLAKEEKDSGKTITKKQLTKQLARDVEVYLPYSYKNTTRKLRKQYNVDRYSVDRK